MATEPRVQPPEQIAFPGFEIGPGDTVVDVGCGDGVVCAYAGRRGAEVIGIDVDPDCVGLAEAAMRGVPARSWRGLVSDCDPIPLPDGVATAVVCTEVLEHVPDPARLAAELARIGKPGARYLISVPDPASESVLRAVAPRWYWEPPYHRRVFEAGQLDALLAAAGLEVVERASSGSYWSLWWAFRMALGEPRPYDPLPDAPLLASWADAWSALMEAPRGPRVAEALDRLVPKSQVRVARKPAGVAATSSFGGPGWSRSWWKRRLRDGVVRLGRFDVRWSVRRAAGAGHSASGR